MEIAFYLSALVAILSTFRVITHTDAVHALLYLIVSLLAIAMVFFALGAPFAAALEIIVYAGAIMVLFVFVIMMLNVGQESIERERRWLRPGIWTGPAILAAILLVVLAIALWGGGSLGGISGDTLQATEVGIRLFGPYLLMVELASFLLLAALVAAVHVGRDEERQIEPDRTMNEPAQRGPDND
ncbi:NADH dehydrogenase subunit J [Kushneria sinocarnis]|uniref:NADH-quinone oxidoreductase subunit J n=1 Tax=Kushneria sinocarnis TaxID=595502 RepID=A0A420X188_9GAMM|nr:NADH-quinone oxidoreductase subunit J [Kushneria sinocarnis]RKR07445.1 NADH dehydrogenase subunit J [Kushneria sinocarnis]